MRMAAWLRVVGVVITSAAATQRARATTVSSVPVTAGDTCRDAGIHELARAREYRRTHGDSKGTGSRVRRHINRDVVALRKPLALLKVRSTGVAVGLYRGRRRVDGISPEERRSGEELLSTFGAPFALESSDSNKGMPCFPDDTCS